MRSTLSALSSGLLVLAAVGAGALALHQSTDSAIAARPPEPAPLPKRWQLDVKTSPLRTTVISEAGGRSRVYFYMTYQVTNNSTSDLLFAPLFELATDQGTVVRSGRDVPQTAVRQIMSQLNNPLLEDQIGIVGTLLRGEENAKEGVVIWAAPALHLSELAVYAAGFSGETATIELPNPITAVMERKVLRKTLELRYRVEGDMLAGGLQPLEPVEQRWIMR